MMKTKISICAFLLDTLYAVDRAQKVGPFFKIIHVQRTTTIIWEKVPRKNALFMVSDNVYNE